MADYNTGHHYRVEFWTGEWMCPLLPVMPEAVHRSLHYHVQSVAYIVVGVVYILAPSVDAHSTYM